LPASSTHLNLSQWSAWSACQHDFCLVQQAGPVLNMSHSSAWCACKPVLPLPADWTCLGISLSLLPPENVCQPEPYLSHQTGPVLGIACPNSLPDFFLSQQDEPVFGKKPDPLFC
jgi:hypothetical protein